MKTRKKINESAGDMPLTKKKQFYALSDAQFGYWIFYKMKPDSQFCNCHVFKHLTMNLDIIALAKAVKFMISRHEILRTNFKEINGNPVQVIHKNSQTKLGILDLSREKDEKIKKIKLKKTIKETVHKSFKLEIESLLRVKLIKLSGKKYVFLLVTHHIIFDYWSLEIFFRELLGAYNSFNQNREPNLPLLPIQFKDYAEWEQSFKNRRKLKKQEEYWLSKLSGNLPVLDFPLDKSRPILRMFNGSVMSIKLDRDIAEKIFQLIQKNEATLFAFIFSVFNIFLYKITGQKDIIVGMPIAHRDIKKLENIIGVLFNNLPVRTKIDPNQIFISFLSLLNREIIEAIDNKNYPLERLIEKINPRGDFSKPFLFNASCQLYYQHKFEDPRWNQHKQIDLETAQVDLRLFVFKKNDGLTLNLNYNADVFNQNTIKQWLGYLKTLIVNILTTPQAKLGDLEIISSEQKKYLIKEYNNTKTDYPKDKTVHQLFKEQARKTPDNIAVVEGKDMLTYCQLDRKSNRLARILIRNKSEKNLIGVYAERSANTVIALLGILKAGAAYLPIDPDYPKKRVLHMLNDSNCDVIIVDKFRLNLILSGKIINNAKIIICLDEIAESNNFLKSKIKLLDRKDILNESDNDIKEVKKSNDTNNLAYVIYTSGSTGKPKGVMISHMSLTNTLFWLQDEFKLKSNDNIAQKTPISFTDSVWEFFWPLIVGAKLTVFKKEILQNPEKLYFSLLEEKITLTTFVPSVMRFFLETVKQLKIKRKIKSKLPYLKWILNGGEALPNDLVRSWYEIFPGAKIANTYGMTESAIYATNFIINEKPSKYQQKVLIGKPIANTHIYIMDKGSHDCPCGIPGEICIGGVGITKGYLNNQKLTRQAFVNHPLTKERIYRTGDMGRMCSDGNIEYLGRIDDQIEIRGNRVEPGEILVNLTKYPNVKQATVIIRKEIKTEENYLACYYVSEAKITAEKLRNYLKNILPDYMIPDYFIWMKKFPLNVNGKLDKNALPDPKKNYVRKRQDPISELEKELADIWKKVLNVKKISINDSFFELGGHSLKAMKLLFRIKNKFQIDIGLKNFFLAPRIKDIANIIKVKTPIKDIIKRASFKPYYLLSHAQTRHWIYYKMEPLSPFYNISILIKLQGELNASFLNKAIIGILKRHEILRMNILEIKDIPVQIVNPIKRINLNIIDLSQESSQEKRKKEREIVEAFTKKPFKLESDRLIRFQLLKIKEAEYSLIIAVHHIIFDYWSSNVLLKELSELYNAYLENRKPELPALPIQFKDYAEWERSKENQKRLEKQEKYWLQKLSGDLPVLDLPIDKIRPSVLTYDGQNEFLKLDVKTSKAILNYCRGREVTLFTLVMSVFLVFLNKLTNQEDIIVGMPTANRDHPELENVIGVLVNSLVIRNKVNPEQKFETLLNQIKQNVLEAMENKDCSMDQLIEKLNPERDTSRSPLFSVVCQVFRKQDKPDLKNILVQYQKINIDTTTADLRFYITQTEKEIFFNLNYNTDLFHSATIKNWLKHMVALTKNILDNPEKKISQLELISQKEKQDLLAFSNDRPNYPQNKALHQLFEKQAKKVPNNVAIVFEGEKLTYQDLNQRSNQFAHYLLSRKIQKEEIVLVILDNSPELVISILGILKAGGAFVLINKDTPKIRIDKMIKDTSARIIISEMIFSKKQEEISKQKKINPELDIQPNNLSNILYTSSTTGEPKGVMLEHRNIVKYACQLGINLKIKATDHLAQNASVSYAIALWHIFTPLFFGAKLSIYPEEISRDPFKLFSLARKDKIRLLETTPSFMNAFLDSANRGELSDLVFKELILTGENILDKLIQKLSHINPGLKIFSHYGQAEIQTPTRLYEIKKDNRILIGRPENGSQIYILDENRKLVPKGLPGMIYASGEDLLFRGYLNDPQKTKEVVIPHPFIRGKMIYRTGDIGKMHPDGNIEYLGRADQQIKIQGNRVEPGEVESCLNRHPNLKQGVVLAKKDKNNENYLVAYYATSVKTSTEELRDYLKNILPAFMIPSYFIEVDKFPLNQNGKLDNTALPKPDKKARSNRYQPPRTELEKKLAGIWQEVLGIEKIGMNDSFFESGGHSLKAIKLLSIIKHKLKINLQLKDIFKNTTIKELERALLKLGNAEKLPAVINSAKGKKFFYLSEMQKLNWKRHLEEDYFKTYDNFLSSFTLKGNLNKLILEKSFSQVIARHESFRTNYKLTKEEPSQFIKKSFNFKLVSVDLSQFSKKQQREKMLEIVQEENNRGFNLEKDLLMRAKIIKLSNDKHVLLISMDHIAFDEESFAILFGELSILYGSYIHGENPDLPKVRLQYKDYAEWEYDNLKKGIFDKQKKYWIHKFGNKIPILNLPYDNSKFATGIKLGEQAKKISFINSELLKKIEIYCENNNITFNIFFFSIFNLFLFKITNQPDLISTSLLSIRNDKKLESTIGLLFVPLANRIKINEKAFLKDFIKSVKNNVLESFANKDFPFSRAIEEVNQKIYPSRYPNIFFQFYQQKENFKLFGLQVTKIKRQDKEKLHFDICMKLRYLGDNLMIYFYYKKGAFKPDTVEKFLLMFKNMSEKVVDNYDEKIEDIVK